MRRRVQLLVALMVAVLALSSAAQATGAIERGTKTTLEVLDGSQREILKRGAIRVAVGSGAETPELRVESSTFDSPGFTKLTQSEKVELAGPGTTTVKLPLTGSARREIAGCESRALRAKGEGSSSAEVSLVRDTSRCKPGKVNLSDADRCSFIAAQRNSLCLLPFPDDYYTAKDRDTATRRRIDLKTASMPRNELGVPIEAGPYNQNDGFSPGQTIVVRIPGLDTPKAIAKTKPVGLARLGDYKKEKQPVVVLDATTGKRWPIWVELDANATDPSRAALLIHPARNFDAEHKYIVAMRNLKNGAGKVLEAPAGFRYLRDDLPSREAAIAEQGSRYEKIFKKLRKAEIDRSDLYLAWDFTVASDENIAGRVLKMRDESFAQLGDTTMDDLTVQGSSPTFAINQIEDFTPAEDAEVARRVRGSFVVPCYLAPNCETGVPGGSFALDADGLPRQVTTYLANFDCVIPRRSVDGPDPQPARPSVYGHGLLGSAGEVNASAQTSLAQTHGFVFCATNEIGLSSADIPLAFTVLQDLGKFPQVGDRLQQGLLNELFLGRLMIHPDGFLGDPAFHVDRTQPAAASPPVIDSSRLYYDGNSQGGIEGGALTAIAPDFTRAALGVTGMNYSVLLNRSVDFDSYTEIAFEPSYTDELERPLALSIVQMLWDRGEANGYAHRMTDDPLPETPPHEVLMNVGFGDHQVSTFTADTEARTIGAKVHKPVVYDGRWSGIQQVWDVPRISSYPYRGSALVYWDSGPVRDDPDSADPADVSGTDPPPIANVPNRSGQDPHEFPRRTPAEQQMVSDFLRPDASSQITDTCLGNPCFDFTFGGP